MNELLSALMGVGILIVFGALIVYGVAKMAEFLHNRTQPLPETDAKILRRKGVIR